MLSDIYKKSPRNWQARLYYLHTHAYGSLLYKREMAKVIPWMQKNKNNKQSFIEQILLPHEHISYWILTFASNGTFSHIHMHMSDIEYFHMTRCSTVGICRTQNHRSEAKRIIMLARNGQMKAPEMPSGIYPKNRICRLRDMPMPTLRSCPKTHIFLKRVILTWGR